MQCQGTQVAQQGPDHTSTGPCSVVKPVRFCSSCVLGERGKETTAFQRSGFGWFPTHPKSSWNGRRLSMRTCPVVDVGTPLDEAASRRSRECDRSHFLTLPLCFLPRTYLEEPSRPRVFTVGAESSQPARAPALSFQLQRP